MDEQDAYWATPDRPATTTGSGGGWGGSIASVLQAATGAGAGIISTNNALKVQQQNNQQQNKLLKLQLANSKPMNLSWLLPVVILLAVGGVVLAVFKRRK